MKRRTFLASAAALAACSRLPTTSDPVARAQQLLSGMSLEDKVGQTMSVAFHGDRIPDTLERVIREQRVGSVIVFKENIASPARLASLLADLQRIAREARLPPLLFPIDQEGGPVVRLGKEATVLPSAMALAAAPDPGAAVARAAEITAREMKALGLNFVLAPVADVNNNARNPIILSRSFGSDPQRVASLASRMVRAYAEAGLLCCAKHFPGHGDTGVDSHTGLPELDVDVARLEQVELVPFRAVIAAGVPSVMTAHIRLPRLDPTPNVSATLSPSVVSGLLRERLGFRGLVVSDDLEMGAITRNFTTADAAAMALAAGADLLLYRFTLEQQRAGHRLIADRVRSGAIPSARLHEAAQHVLEAKARWGVLDRAPAADPSAVGSEAHRASALDLARASITLLRNRGVLPLTGKRVLVLSPDPDDLKNDEALVDGQLPFGTHLAKRLSVTQRELELRPTTANVAAHVAAARQHDVVVVATFEVAKYPAQAMLVTAVATERPVCVVSLRSPYDALAFPDVPAYVCVYQTRDPGCAAATEVLVGARAPAGKLPVDVPGLFPIDSGLSAL